MAKAIKADTQAARSINGNDQKDSGNIKAMLGESRLLEPTVTKWQPEDDSGIDTSDNGQVKAPDYQDLGAANRAKAEALLGLTKAEPVSDDDEPTETPKAKAPKVETKPKADADEIPEVKTAPETEDATTESKPEALKPRKEILANLAAEKQRRQLEQSLKQERDRRTQLEQTLTKGSIMEFAKARGLTKEQAMDELLMNLDGLQDTSTAQPSTPALDPEVQTLKNKVAAMEAEKAQQAARQLQDIVDAHTANLDVPFLKAATTVTLQDAAGNPVKVPTRDAILTHAENLWKEAGSPAGQAERLSFLAKAAEEIDQALEEEHRPVLEAYEKKKGKVAPPTPEAPKLPKKNVPAVGKKSGGGAAKPSSSELSMDFDERRAQIAARFGFTS